MKRIFISCLCMLVLTFKMLNAQNIHGIINHYAAVSTINGQTITVNTATSFAVSDKILLIQMKGAEIDTNSNSNFGDITALNQAGVYDFLNIASINGNNIVTESLPTNTYQIPNGVVQIVRIPKFCKATVVGSLTCLPWNGTVGGILAFEAATLTLNNNIDVNGKGFRGGNLINGQFNCSTTKYKGTAGADGAKKGESISSYIIGYDGARGKQANGGGGGNPGNSGGGGGALAGFGGFGGHEYDGCGISDERGIGGSTITPSLNRMILGGGGGAGYRDNNMTSSAGGNGGGIVYIKTNQLIANNQSISSNGASVTIISDAESGGGGGAGGTVFLACNLITGSLNVSTSGGNGGSNYNNMFVINCHGTGGGGGGGIFAYSGATIPSNINYTSMGGAAGIITNSASTCYSTTYGASDGGAGMHVGNLPTNILAFVEPNLTVTGGQSICSGETTTLTANGASSYKWNNSSTQSSIAFSPTTTATFTLSGQLTGTNACTAELYGSIFVAACTSLNSLTNNQKNINVFPNPFKHEITIECEDLISLKLYNDIGGRILEEKTNETKFTIKLSHLKIGVYFLELKTEEGLFYRKILKSE